MVGIGGIMSTVGMAAKACTLIQAGQYVKAAGLAYTTAAMAYMTADNACKTYNLLVENDFVLTDEVLMSTGETIMAGIGTVAGFKAFNSCLNETAAMIQRAEASCFVAGTQVLTREGFKNIEDIQPGDYVYSTSDETGESDYKEVLEVFVKETEVITHVFYATKDSDGQEPEIHEIETTLNHRFWSEGEWKAAGTLKAGDLLTLVEGTQVEVTDVTFEDRHETVYNMEVADYHTYYVGEDGVWVHNRYGQQGGTTGKGKNKKGNETTKLYRVMSNEEYESLINNGKFTPYDRAMEEKWFATSPAKAEEWASHFYPEGNYRMVEIEVSTSSLSNMYYNAHLDGIGPAYCSPLDILNDAIQSIRRVR